MATIHTVVEWRRGCGFRKPGGLYLRTEPRPMRVCGRLPLPLTVCPTCGAGVPYSRGLSWIDPAAMFRGVPCRHDRGAGVGLALALFRSAARRYRAAPDAPVCAPDCILHNVAALPRSILLWIGRTYYPTPGDWLAEAAAMGISRRIKAVPRGFVIGETLVFVAHLDVIPNQAGKMSPAVFHVFMPSAVEYVVTGDEDDDTLTRMETRGIRLVRVCRETGSEGGLFDDTNEGGTNGDEDA